MEILGAIAKPIDYDKLICRLESAPQRVKRELEFAPENDPKKESRKTHINV